MNTQSAVRQLDDEELNAVQGGMSCCNGAHLNEASNGDSEPGDSNGARRGADRPWPLDLRHPRGVGQACLEDPRLVTTQS